MSPSSSEATLTLSPSVRIPGGKGFSTPQKSSKLRRANAKFFSPEKTPKAPSPKKTKYDKDIEIKTSPKVTSTVMKKAKYDSDHFQTPSPMKSKIKTSPKAPKRQVKKVRVVKTMLKEKKGTSKASSSSSPSVPGGRKPFKKPASRQGGEKTISKKDMWERVMMKINMEWNDLVHYNKSFFAPPPCTKREFRSSTYLSLITDTDTCHPI